MVWQKLLPYVSSMHGHMEALWIYEMVQELEEAKHFSEKIYDSDLYYF